MATTIPSSAKAGVGTALGRSSHVWFTVSHGILNEVYYRAWIASASAIWA
jgi:hypothetical protein